MGRRRYPLGMEYEQGNGDCALVGEIRDTAGGG